MKQAGRGCGTCRDRHLGCDRSLPVCLRCVKSNLQCQRYGMRLSWPRANDRKRAMLAKVPPVKANSDLASPLRILNTSIWDIEIHHYLTGSGIKSPTQRIIPTAMSWSPFKSDNDNNLLQYFESIASTSLTTVSEDSSCLRDVLIRVALSNNGPSSAAVLKSLLAFSSLHRYGLQLHAARLKLSALSALVSSAKAGVGAHEVIPHLAAGMLLCCFEIQQPSETSSQWLSYISGVKNVLRAAHLGSIEWNSDMATLLSWVSYHDVLAGFSLSHWRHRGSRKAKLPGDLNILVPQVSIYKLLEIPDIPMPCSNMLRLASEVFNAGLEPSDIRHRGVNHKNLLTSLEWKISQFAVLEGPGDPMPCQMVPETSRTLEIIQLTLLVFLERASGSSPAQSEKMSTRIDRAFTIFSQLEMWQRQLPLLILGCEARTDRDRIVVLDLISRTEQSTCGRSLENIKCLIQSLWAQDDLAEGDLTYIDKIKAVLSSSNILPTFV